MARRKTMRNAGIQMQRYCCLSTISNVFHQDIRLHILSSDNLAQSSSVSMHWKPFFSLGLGRSFVLFPCLSHTPCITFDLCELAGVHNAHKISTRINAFDHGAMINSFIFKHSLPSIFMDFLFLFSFLSFTSVLFFFSFLFWIFFFFVRHSTDFFFFFLYRLKNE